MFPNPPLLPQDLIKKAAARIWIDFANTRFVTAFTKVLRSQDAQEQKVGAQELRDHLLFINPKEFYLERYAKFAAVPAR